MASTNHTQNYNLPQFIGTDKPTWLGDVNSAMATIDTTMKANADNVASVRTDTDTNSGAIINLQGTVQGLSDTVSTLSGKVTTAELDIDNLEADTSSLDGRATSIEGRLGSANISDIGNGTVTGAIKSINDNLGVVTNHQINVNVANANQNPIHSVNLDAGTYFISLTLQFAVNSSGIRQVAFTTGTGLPNADSGFPRESSPAISSFPVLFNISNVITLEQPQAINVIAYQNSGSTLGVVAGLTVTKLK